MSFLYLGIIRKWIGGCVGWWLVGITNADVELDCRSKVASVAVKKD